MTQNHDQARLKHALELAKIRRGFCAPNPSVGAVIVKEENVIATGYHFAAGQAHAEVDALRKIANLAQGATAYVTLEPCCHFGKTPPCTDALIQAGVKRVVYGYRDVNPIVAGKSEAILNAAGIACEYMYVPEIAEFYESYQYWQTTQKPFVTAKIALSLDGKIAGNKGAPIQITGAALQVFTHMKRKSSDAILTTVKTIIQDNPQLNARYQNEIIPKPIYILDSQLNMPMTAKICATAKSLTLFHAKNVTTERLQSLTALGIRCIEVEENNQGLNLHQVIDILGKEGIHDLWIEAGGACFSAFAKQQLLQQAFIYISPWSIGNGVAAFQSSIDFRGCKIHWQQFDNDVLCQIHW